MKTNFITTLIGTLLFASINVSAAVVKIAPATFKSDEKHLVQLLDVGGPALYSMLKVINEAHSSVYITNYLINYWDYSALYILQALMNKKAQNPNFQAYFLLEDSTSTASGYKAYHHWQWRDFVQTFKEKGIEFRIFNPRAFSPANSNIRQHQKIIAADVMSKDGKIDYQMVIGGRNFSDDYYGIVPHYNRLDKEIYVKGEIVGQAINEFKVQWSDDRVYDVLHLSEDEERKIDEAKLKAETIYERGRMRDEISSALKEIKHFILHGPSGLTIERLRWVKTGSENVTIIYSDDTVNFLKNGPKIFVDKKTNEKTEVRYEDISEYMQNPPKNVNLVSEQTFFQKLSAEYYRHSLPQNYPVLEISEIVLGYDQPSLFSKKDNFVPYFYETIKKAEREVIFENQYFIPSTSALEVLNHLAKKKIPVHFLTNSLVSQDESNPGILTHDEIRSYQKSNPHHFFPYAFRGQKLAGIEGALWWDGTAQNADNTWQIHGKSVVIDGVSSWIGSNNFDNRSESFNPEMGIYIENNPTFAAQLKKSTLNNINNADKIEVEGEYWKNYDKKVKGEGLIEKTKSSAWSLLLQATQPFW